MRDFDQLFLALRRSPFRSRIDLSSADQRYLDDKEPDVLQRHTWEFVQQRLAPARPANDGRQTPWRGHPVFTAQHATATCCRKCLAKWHEIPRGRALYDEEVEYIVRVVEIWLAERRSANGDRSATQQRTLFD